MKTETIETLRARAKRLGLSGYSKLRKGDLLELLAGRSGKVTAKPGAGTQKSTARRIVKTKKTVAKAAVTTRSPSVPPNPKPASVSAPMTNIEMEQQVETVKYAFAQQGAQEPTYAADLGEDFGHLPTINEPMLCLLPQKPGVLHGYWVLPRNTHMRNNSIKLRLARDAGDHLAILDEHSIPTHHGHWYFHVGENTELDMVYLQLGHYQPDGVFVSLFKRGMARIPSLYASTRTDRRWWVSDEQFRAMYQRTGGRELGRKLGWPGSASSPGGPLAWPGSNRSNR